MSPSPARPQSAPRTPLWIAKGKKWESVVWFTHKVNLCTAKQMGETNKTKKINNSDYWRSRGQRQHDRNGISLRHPHKEKMIKTRSKPSIRLDPIWWKIEDADIAENQSTVNNCCKLLKTTFYNCVATWQKSPSQVKDETMWNCQLLKAEYESVDQAPTTRCSGGGHLTSVSLSCYFPLDSGQSDNLTCLITHTGRLKDSNDWCDISCAMVQWVLDLTEAKVKLLLLKITCL